VEAARSPLFHHAPDDVRSFAGLKVTHTVAGNHDWHLMPSFSEI